MTILAPIDTAIDDAIQQLVTDLEVARDHITVFGLAKQQFGPTPDGPACIIGALLRAQGPGNVLSALRSPRMSRAVYALTTVLGVEGVNDTHRRAAIYKFNDDKFTTEADVISVFNAAIEGLSS